VVEALPAVPEFAPESRAAETQPVQKHAERSRLKMWRKKLRHQFAFPVEPAPVRKEPTKIEWQQSDEDIPSVDDVLEALASEGSPAPALPIGAESPALNLAAVAIVPEPVKAPIAVANIESENTPVAASASDEVEEITHVRPPKPPAVRQSPPEPVRFRIPVEHPSNEIYFVPTILGNDVDRGRSVSTDAGDTLLSAFYSPTSARPLPYRAFAAGGAALLVIGLVLFGNSPVWRFASAEHSDRTDPVATTAKVSLPIASSVPAPAVVKKKTVRSADKVARENTEPDASDAKRPPAKETSADKRPEKTPVRQPLQKVSATPKLQAQKDLPEKRVLIISNMPAVYTRPRVVKDARP
jgi:hypothetical protein